MKKTWVQGINMTVDPEVHKKIRAAARAENISIRKFMDQRYTKLFD